MTNFNRDGDIMPIEDWEQLAEHKAAETGAAWRIIGAIAAGGVGVALSFELLGLAFGGYFVWSAYERIKQSGKNIKAVRDFGCIAHLMDEEDLRGFNKQFGASEVYEQLSFARERGWELTKFAQNWINSHEREIPQTPTQEVKKFDKARAQATTENNAPTRIQSSQPTTVQTSVDVYNPTVDSQIDLIGELTNELNNLFIVGLGGSGKGMLTANALRAIKAKHNWKIFLINGKDDPKEAGYFEGIVDVEKRLHCESATPSAVATWFEAAVKEYDQFALANNGALLIIDEGTIIGARLKSAKSTALGDKLIGITSCGGSQGKNVWFIAQTPYVGANGGDLSSISQLTPIAIVSHKNLAVLDTWKRASIFKKFDSNEIAKLVEASECDRAVYFGKNAQWYSMPVLKNYSAFNRDTGEIIGEASQPKTTIQRSEDSFKADVSNPPRSKKKKIDFNTPEWIDFFSDDGSDDADENLSEIAREILEYISRNQPVSKDTLIKWCNRNDFKLDKRKPAIQELLESELITFEDGAFNRAGHPGHEK